MQPYKLSKTAKEETTSVDAQPDTATNTPRIEENSESCKHWINSATLLHSKSVNQTPSSNLICVDSLYTSLLSTVLFR